MSKVIKFPNSNPALVSLRQAGLHDAVRHAHDWDDTDLGMMVQALSAEHASGDMGRHEFLAELSTLGALASRLMER